jgi:hypothetical protein
MILLQIALHAALLICVTVPLAPAQIAKTCDKPTLVSDQKFVPGQVWSFQSRPFEPNATLTILRVETLPKAGEVIHVRLDGIRLRNCSGGPEPSSIQHAPFTKEAIERSAMKLLKTGPIPEYEDGYKEWLSHCGGVYTITAAEMVVVDEKTFNSSSGCTP